MTHSDSEPAAKSASRRLFVYNGGFLTQPRIKRILALSGYDVSLGKPGAEDLVGVWGQSPTAWRGEAVAGRTKAPVLRVEDAFLRSVRPGREGEPPLGLLLDRRGVHFDPSTPSDLEVILRDAPLDDTALLDRARDGIATLAHRHLSKYNAFDLTLAPPDPGYVLVIDQTEGDASVSASRADRNTFLEMLFVAREEHPAAPILIKTHPETQRGHRGGHYRDTDLGGNVRFYSDPVPPQRLLEGAIAVYTVSSQFGFEAILAGHRPVVFGQPFYIGWGLTDDRTPLDRRQRKLTRAQLFAGAMMLYPRWYDPFHDRLCDFETAVQTLDAAARAWRDDHRGWVASGMRLWKRAPLQKAFGGSRKIVFQDDPTKARALAAKTGRRQMAWAGKAEAHPGAVRVEDGFLRSRGLGADLAPPLSLVLDDLGIYYDPTRPSRLEALIEASTTLPDSAIRRAEALIDRIRAAQLTKYNLRADGLPHDLPPGRRILVPGQVADDASIRLGTAEVATNRALLEATRAANPAAVILYKPHPDVEAGLRDGAVPDAQDLADIVLDRASPLAALDAVDAVWTMTSTLGFEALLRGVSVTCLGTPFYAGWGLTDDRVMPLPRRSARPTLAQFAHAVLIDYPRYFDPVTGLPCPVEVVVERLAAGTVPQPSRANRLLAKLQGALASYAHLWR
ncbi:capsular polysaccharide biosynthesis protein [Thalassorhabdomicrobium marinisediminis]|uniref:Beta-3-deoxy-D-manno-oct-2-ulosonic acid transferase n=1 Tax=Thalassorhabdomicrobium marinisediminis TaxID=2170577 RepID=A0A2T7FXH9_9RHOB|nr:capsular polysaccharide biosynthesis protein [Thalassorhabdomicrobium marinisediminis]PVA06880.1 beta-3-deoxy-D-manno-oct-2-ulosonic acid transferase [Thalassorhabdomicrobium marinisediminis]